jgi:SAM-dependent methyltransferase
MTRGVAAGDRAPVEHFERLYGESADPWRYATSEYEREKYRRTLSYLPDRGGRALELGCSIGVLTESLAERCERLIAVDFIPTAVARARHRVRGHPHAEVLCRTLPEEMPAGPFDTILCSEVLYYWSPDLVAQGLARIEAALAPGGTLVAVHWRGSDPRRELTGDDVHRLIRARERLRWNAGEATPGYLLDRWEG